VSFVVFMWRFPFCDIWGWDSILGYCRILCLQFTQVKIVQEWWKRYYNKIFPCPSTIQLHAAIFFHLLSIVKSLLEVKTQRTGIYDTIHWNDNCLSNYLETSYFLLNIIYCWGTVSVCLHCSHNYRNQLLIVGIYY
jgi:hypothetical protein